MSIEIERKFLVIGEKWRDLGHGEMYRQGYLSTEMDRTVRIRTISDKGFLTIKGKTQNATRNEFEYEIPFSDAEFMLDELCQRPVIEKTRYTITQDDLTWEIDEFWGENKGLIIAEVELKDVNKKISIPDWIGREVTDDPAYYNANLVIKPFSTWIR